MTDKLQRPDWLGLCEELANTLERAQRALRFEGGCSDATDNKRRALISRARPALAQPEPEAVVVTDEEAEQLHDNLRTPIYDRLSADTPEFFVGYAPVRPGDFARAVLARFGGRPSPAAEGEVARLVGLFSSWADAYPDGVKLDPQWLARAADLLERQAAPVPVAVSERLPGPEDLNDKGECWEWDPASDAWVLLRPNGLIFRPGPWLPAHALPLPTTEAQP